MEFRFVAMGSAEWTDARQLRHSLFFQPQGLPLSVMDDAKEASGMHLVAMMDDNLVAYGRLNPLGPGEYQLSQMVVAPQWQGQGIGRDLLNRLIDRARDAGATTLRLEARISATGFYLKAGFRQVGDVYPSEKTGLPHIPMMLSLHDPRD